MREILAEVAAGRMDPTEAGRLLEQLRHADEADEADETPDRDAWARASDAPSGSHPREDQREPTTSTTERLRIRAVGRRVKIVGEPFVSTVAVDGPHVIRQEGNTVVVTSEGEFGASLDGFTLLRTRSIRDVQERVFDFGRELSIRVNPALAVEAEVTGGSLSVERLPYLEQVRATAGSARVRDVTGNLDLLVQAGSAHVEGAITKGRTRLRAESGSLQLLLLPGSSARIRPEVQLGRIQWEPPGDDRDEHVVGSGDALVDLELMMGTATVKEA